MWSISAKVVRFNLENTNLSISDIIGLLFLLCLFSHPPILLWQLWLHVKFTLILLNAMFSIYLRWTQSKRALPLGFKVNIVKIPDHYVFVVKKSMCIWYTKKKTEKKRTLQIRHIYYYINVIRNMIFYMYVILTQNTRFF